MTLEAFFREHPRAVLGFSGGVDSAYLLYAARSAGAECIPALSKAPSSPPALWRKPRRWQRPWASSWQYWS